MSGFQKSVKLYPAVGVPGQEVNPGQAIYTAENYISDGTLAAKNSARDFLRAALSRGRVWRRSSARIEPGPVSIFSLCTSLPPRGPYFILSSTASGEKES